MTQHNGILERPLQGDLEGPFVLPEDLPLVLDRSATRSMAVQLADGLRAAAGCGAVRVGDRLPSTRALATTLGVSRTVTAAAYDALHAEGWICGRHGSGIFVTAAPTTPTPDAPAVAASVPPDPMPPDPEWQEPECGTDLRPGAPWSAGLSGSARQYPLGAVLPARRRLALVAWARERGVWVLVAT
ncbi:MAG: GntR family transcriptional regulator [Pseudonocardiaceae bacterium]